MNSKFKKFIYIIVILLVLIFSFWYGGKAPNSRGFKKNSDLGVDLVNEEDQENLDKDFPINEVEKEKDEKIEKEVKNKERDEFLTEPVPADKPKPVEPENVEVKENKSKVSLSVRCDTILDNLDLVSENKKELVPSDGVIFQETQVEFNEGESVFNVLVREMKKNKIHLEFVNTPMYNSAYIEGINNLYAFDCGEKSGWMYRVNGWFPNYGASRYLLKEGDLIEWVYTCDLGSDVGGENTMGGE